MHVTRRGFTLLELLVVIAIVAVIAGLAFPVTARVEQGAKASACLSNLKQLGVALNLYLGDHKEIMPPKMQAGRQSTSDNVQVLDNTLNAYVSDQRVFVCPGDTQGIGAASGTSYFWNSALDGYPVGNLQFFSAVFALKGNSSQIPLMSDKEGFHPYAANKVNLLYADGHASQDLKFVTSQ